MCSADKVYRIKIEKICGGHVYIKIEKLDYAKPRWDLARLKSKHIRSNMCNDENVKRMVE